MSDANRKNNAAMRVSQHTGRELPDQSRSRRRWVVWLAPIAGFLSLVWFLARVVPKPSRASYPCQRIAFPIASGFVIWLTTLVTATLAFGQARQFLRRSRVAMAAACFAVAVVAGVVSIWHMPETPAQAAVPVANEPIGVAKGIHPGRVVWVHDPNATDWIGPTGGDYYWESGHADQAAVDTMMSKSIQSLTGQATDVDAWDALFTHFNATHDRGDIGYTPGEKISIKVNFVGSILESWMNLPATYDQIGEPYKINTSAELMLALLRQLIYQAGVPQDCISIGDTITCFPNHLWQPLHDEFPNVVYLDKLGILGRTKAVASGTSPIHWSSPDYDPAVLNIDTMPQTYVTATYHINLSDLKGHEGGGVTLCGKNYYGSLCHVPDAGGYFNRMHNALPYGTSGYGKYRTLVDLVAHKDTGGKGLLYLVDGLWSGSDAGSGVERWQIAPFNGDWPNSLFASQDPVAIDSVGYDFLYAESLVNGEQPFPSAVDGGDDYLRQLASSDHWPTTVTYDPEDDGTPIASMGGHEHWNNATDRQYSRNLGEGVGIELVAIGPSPGKGDFDQDGDVDRGDWTAMAMGMTDPGDASPPAAHDLDGDGDCDLRDVQIFTMNFSGTR